MRNTQDSNTQDNNFPNDLPSRIVMADIIGEPQWRVAIQTHVYSMPVWAWLSVIVMAALLLGFATGIAAMVAGV